MKKYLIETIILTKFNYFLFSDFVIMIIKYFFKFQFQKIIRNSHFCLISFNIEVIVIQYLIQIILDFKIISRIVIMIIIRFNINSMSFKKLSTLKHMIIILYL